MARREFTAVVLDLYDTIVRWDPAQLPMLEWQGRQLRSTAPWLLPRLRECFGGRIEPDAWLDAYHAVYRDVFQAREAQSIEITCQERFTRTFARFGIADSELHQVAADFARLHMAGVRRITSSPEERAWAVRRLAPFYRLGLLSNFDDSQTGREVLFDTGLSHLFEAVIISADTGVRKPNPKIFEQMLAMLGIPARQILFVGDTPREDIVGAAGVGMRTAWISAGKGPWPEGLAAADYVIGDLAELPALLGC